MKKYWITTNIHVTRLQFTANRYLYTRTAWKSSENKQKQEAKIRSRWVFWLNLELLNRPSSYDPCGQLFLQQTHFFLIFFKAFVLL